jgi:hypothetical protein
MKKKKTQGFLKELVGAFKKGYSAKKKAPKKAAKKRAVPKRRAAPK